MIYSKSKVSSSFQPKWLNSLLFRTDDFCSCYTPIATISRKRGFSVVTVAKGWPALFFQEFCILCTAKYWMLKSTGRPGFGQISSKYSKIHLRGVVKVSVLIKATFHFHCCADLSVDNATQGRLSIEMPHRLLLSINSVLDCFQRKAWRDL